MMRRIVDLRKWLNVMSAVVLVAGLSSAIWIYQTAEDKPYGALGYEGGDGSTYPVMPEDSKKYLRDLELYGGKANVLMDELRRGFVGLWHGKSLAYTVGGLAILVSFGVFYVANHFPSRPEPGPAAEDDQKKIDR